MWADESLQTPDAPNLGWPVLSQPHRERAGSAPNAKEPTPSPYLGTHNGAPYYLLYNGILRDRRPQSGNVLTRAILTDLNQNTPHPEGPTAPRILYDESCRLSPATLARENITFKQAPYEIKAR